MAELENPTKLPYSYEAVVRAAVRVFICEYFRTGREPGVTSGGLRGSRTSARPLSASASIRRTTLCTTADTISAFSTPSNPSMSRSRAKDSSRIRLDDHGKIADPRLRLENSLPCPRRQIGISFSVRDNKFRKIFELRRVEISSFLSTEKFQVQSRSFQEMDGGGKCC